MPWQLRHRPVDRTLDPGDKTAQLVVAHQVVLRSLTRRGLRSVKLVISDEHKTGAPQPDPVPDPVPSDPVPSRAFRDTVPSAVAKNKWGMPTYPTLASADIEEGGAVWLRYRRLRRYRNRNWRRPLLPAVGRIKRTYRNRQFSASANALRTF